MTTRPSAGTGKDRLIWSASLLLLALVLIFAAVLLSDLRSMARANIGNALNTVVTSTGNALQQWSGSMRHSSTFWASDPRIVRYSRTLANLQSSGDSQRIYQVIEGLRMVLNPELRHHDLQGFFIVSSDFNNLASARDENIGERNLLADSPEGYLDRVFSGEALLTKPVQSDVLLMDGIEPLADQTSMFALAPIHDEEGQVIAAFSLRLSPSTDFNRILTGSRIGNSGTTEVYDGQGRLLSRIGPAGLESPGPERRVHEVGRLNERGENLDGYLDRRGVEVVGAWDWNPLDGIGLRVQIDFEEAYGVLARTRLMVVTALTLILLIGFMVARGLMTGRRQAMELAALKSKETADSHSRLQAILDFTPAVVYMKDGEGRYLMANSEFERIFDLASGDIIGHTDYDIFPARYAEEFARNDREVFERRAPINREETALLDDGEHQYVSIKFPLFDENDDPWAICGISTDISERKQLEEVFAHIARAMSFNSGSPGFYQEIVDYVSRFLGVDFVLIATCNREVGNRLESLAVSHHGKVVDQVSYEYIATPCERVLGERSCKHASGVQALYPNSETLARLNAEAYAGASLGRSDGPSEGLICVVHSEPINNVSLVQSILDILAARVTTELESRDTQNALERSTQNFEVIFRDNPEPMLLASIADGCVVDVNHQLERLCGRSREEVIGRPVSELGFLGAQQDYKTRVRRLLSGESTCTWEVSSRMGSGELKMFRTSANVVAGSPDSLVLTIVEDVTERRNYERSLVDVSQALALKFGEELLANLVRQVAGSLQADIAFVGVLESGEGGRSIRSLAVFADGDVGENFVYGLDDTPCADVLAGSACVYPEDVQSLYPEDTLLQDMGVQAYAGAPLYDLDNKPVGILVALFRRKLFQVDLARNILMIFAARAAGEIARAATEEEQRKLHEQLHAAQKMEAIGHLAGGIAHDFNNILASVLGYTQLARDLPEERAEKRQSYLEEVTRAGERAKQLVANLLAFGRNDPGEPQPIDLRDQISDVLSMLKPTIPVSKTLVAEIDREQSLGMVLADRVQIHQVLMNLCINARDAIGDHGRIVVSAHQSEHQETVCTSCQEHFSGQMVELRVSDTGVGVDEKLLPRVFEPFYSTKESGKGSGMGLSVVHGIVHVHGGHVRISATPAGGATFSLFFPVYRAAAESVDRPALVVPLSGQNDTPKRIMVVDDEEAIADYLKILLEKRGYHVTAVTDPVSALEVLKEHAGEIDLIITDQTMPELTGLELAGHALELKPEMPIILCSGYSESLNEQSLERAGIDVFLSKPVEQNELLAAIRKFPADPGPAATDRAASN